MAQFYLLSVLSNMVARADAGGGLPGGEDPLPRLVQKPARKQAGHGDNSHRDGNHRAHQAHRALTGRDRPCRRGPSARPYGHRPRGILLVEAFRQKVESQGESLKKISTAVLTYRVPVGIAGVVIAGLCTFCFPAW